ncbi:MAG: carboxypeptidase regulatory-like domain-containing protein [Prevotella sp.]|nr:carboxypeptidase regulatory-like domain-containing protein [Prevotella sp.]
MKRFVMLVVLTGLFLSLYAQHESVIVDRIISQLQQYPQEKTYVHTDATDYVAGDRVWLKVYVVNALSHEPVDESLYAYVELLSPDGTLTARVKLICRDGVYAGYVDIPASADAGRYFLRSYTELSSGVKGYESVQPLYVKGSRKAAVAQAKSSSVVSVRQASLLQVRRQGRLLRLSTSATADSLLLVAHCRAYPFYIGKLDSSAPVVLHQDSIPQGVVSLLLVGKSLNVVDEQLFFSDNGQEECRLTIDFDKLEYRPRELVRVSLSGVSLHEGEQADVSISVRSDGHVGRHPAASIVSHLLLSADIEGGVERPERFSGRQLSADSLLEGRLWRRYDFPRLLQGSYSMPSTARETSQTITGVVRSSVKKRPVAGAKVSLIAPQTGFFASTVSDEKGLFAFPGTDFPSGTQYVLQAVNAKGKDHVELLVSEREVAPFVVPDWEDDAEEASLLAPDDVLAGGQSAYLHDEAIVLDDIEVTAARRNSASEGNVYAQMADVSFGLHKIEELGATCLHELLRHIPGVFVRDNRCYVRAATSIYNDYPAAIAVDGVMVDGSYDLDNIQMQDVARVDVFKTGTTILWGPMGGSGVISITTREGNYGETSDRQANQKKISPLGYQRETPFFVQPSDRRTLYWNPHLTADAFDFNAADEPGTCRMVIEGVTSEGRLIHEERLIEVQ